MLVPVVYNGSSINSGLPGSQTELIVPASTKKNKPKTYSTYGNLGNYSGLSYKEGGSYSGYTPVKADISGVLAAYEQEANTQRDIAKKNYDLATQQANSAYDLGVSQANRNYDTTVSNAQQSRDSARADLLSSIKRFREDNAANQLAQRKSYLDDQARLEAAREQANRQNRISSSARGLGGSGLQQLAQMQNLLAQSEDVSQLANENQASLDKLRQALAREEDDYNTNLKKTDEAYDKVLKEATVNRTNVLDTLLNTKNASLESLLSNYNNTLSGIASALESQKESKIAENDRAYADAVNSARAAAASARANAKTTNYGVVLQNVLDTANVDLRKLANSSKVATIKEYAAKAGLQLEDKQIKKDKEGIKQLIAKTISDNVNDNILTAIDQYGLDQNTYGKMKNDINSMLDYYKFNPYY